MLCAVVVNATIYTFQATNSSSREKNARGEWGEWREWSPSDTKLSIDTNDEKVVLYAKETFSFDIYNIDRFGTDGQGGQAITYFCVDNGGLKCGIRLRKDINGGLQLYVDYGDFSAVFDVYTQGDVSLLFPSQREVEQKELAEARKDAEYGDPIGIYNMGWYYQNGSHGLAKDLNQARSYFQRLTQLGVYLGYNQLAYICAEEGKYSEAHSILDNAISMYNRNGASPYPWDWSLDNLYDSKGDIYLMQNRYQDAMPIYNRLKNSSDDKIKESSFMEKMRKYVSSTSSSTVAKKTSSTSSTSTSKLTAQHYGYYPYFYVTQQNYYVDANGGYFNIGIYGDNSSYLSKCWTNKNWLEEENLGNGGHQFHVKKNPSSSDRYGELYLTDTRGRKITIYVRQAGKK